MPRTTLKADQHFLKHLKKRELIWDNGVAIGVFPDAFILRPPSKDREAEKWLSGQHYEFFEGTHDERLCACCHFIPIEMKMSDALCQMNVGDIAVEGKRRSKTLRVLHQPEAGMPAYSGMHGLPKGGDQVDDELLTLLAELATLDFYEIGTIL